MAGFTRSLTVSQFAAAAASGSLAPKLPGDGGRVMGSPLARVLSQMMLADVRDRFATGTAPDGTRWVPLKYSRPGGGNRPLLDTGVLRASLYAGHDATSIWVATTHPAAVLHHFGGTVRPVRAKMLAIPLTKEARRAGGPRRFGRPLHFRPTRKANRFLLVDDVAGPGEKGTAQFLLVDQVTVVARPFMGTSEKANQRMALALAEAVERGWLSGGM